MRITGRSHVVILAVVAVGVYVLWPRTTGVDAPDRARKPVYYQDSMHPWIKSDRPGRCAVCGCNLTPIYERKGDPKDHVELMSLSSNSVTVLNVQTEAVEWRPLARVLRVAGTLDADNTRKTIVSAPAPGRIDGVSVESAGMDVSKGYALATFYSPDLTFQTRRYIFRDRLPDRTNEFGANPFPEATSRHALGHPTPVRPRPEVDPFYNDLLSPLAGTVTERNVFDGQYVAEGDRLFTVVDCSVLWFRFDVYERQLPWVEIGQNVEVTVEAVPGRTFPAVIAVIEPTIDEATRTVKVRANVSNPAVAGAEGNRRLLRLGMYAAGRVLAGTADALTVPRSAVLFAGSRSRVYVDKGEGRYQLRLVTLGRQGDRHWEVLDGLTEGERVVSAGNVLLDAEAHLQGIVDGPAPRVPTAGASTAAPAERDVVLCEDAVLRNDATGQVVRSGNAQGTNTVTQSRSSREPSRFGARIRRAVADRPAVFGTTVTNAALREKQKSSLELEPPVLPTNLPMPDLPTPAEVVIGHQSLVIGQWALETGTGKGECASHRWPTTDDH